MNALILTSLIIAGFLASMLLVRAPRLALALWLIVMVAVPVWIEVKFVATLPPLSVLFLVLLPATIVAIGWVDRTRLSSGDLVVCLFVALASIGFAFADTAAAAFAAIMTTLLPPYLIGRRLVPTVGWVTATKWLAVSGVVVGAWAIFEYILQIHVFEDFLGTGDVANWHLIQERGLFTRSEGAFGHSIALGGFLAICTPFVVYADFSLRARVWMLLVVAGGTFVTFSRAALIAFAISLAASRIGFRKVLDPREKRLLNATLGISVIVGIPFALNVFDSVESDLYASTQYRVDLTTTFFADMNPFGPGDHMSQDMSGRWFYRSNFGSIDNAYILTVLEHGWVAVLPLLFGLGFVLIRVLRGVNVSPAHVALVGQVFMLSTVALITQYGTAVWMVAGMCAALSRGASVSLDGKKSRAVKVGTSGSAATLAGSY